MKQWSRVGGCAFLAIAYFVAGEVARVISVTDRPIALIWPSTGIALAVLLLQGTRLWPGIAVATFATIVVHGGPVSAALWVSAVDVLEAVIGAVILTKVLAFHPALDRVRDVFALTVVSFALSLASALASSFGIMAAGAIPKEGYEALVSGWWWGHFSADLIVVPLLLTWGTRVKGREMPAHPHAAEIAALVIAVVVVDAVLFGRMFAGWFPSAEPPNFAPYYVLPIMLWAGLRFGPRGGATASFGVSIMALIAIAVGNGAFEQLLDVQSFVAISTITTLILSAMAVERTRAVQRQASIQRAALDAIVSIDTKGHIVEMNPAAERMLGVSAVEVIGRDAGELLVPARARERYRDMLANYARGQTDHLSGRRFRGVILAANGRELDVEVAVAAVTINDESMLTGFIRDVTTERAAAQRGAEMLRQAEHLAHLGSFQLELPTGHLEWSDELFRIFGRDRETFKPSYKTFIGAVHPDDREQLLNALSIALQKKEPFDFEERIVRPGGEIRTLQSHVMVFPGEAGEPVRIGGCCQDVTEQRLIERERDHFADIARTTDDAIIGLSTTMTIETWNAGATKLFGYTQDEVVGRPVTMLAHPLSVEELRRTLLLLTAGEHVARYEMVHVRKDGSTFNAAVTMTAISNRNGKVVGLSKVLRDITERTTFENQLKASLQEKEVLLREIHHRVKNNLQVISSLLNLQVSAESSAKIRRELAESQSRIQSMALVHQLLYESRDLGHIDFTDYLRKLSMRLLGTYSVGPARIDVVVRGESLPLEIDRAISCGLIVNELVANALEHAFPNGRSGLVEISVARDGSQVLLTVRDDGVGVPPEYTVDRVGTFGLQIARTLTAQLEGTFDIRREAGTFVQIAFPAAARSSVRDAA